MEDGTGEFLLRLKHDAGRTSNVGRDGRCVRSNQSESFTIFTCSIHSLKDSLSFKLSVINCSGFVFLRDKTGQGFTKKSFVTKRNDQVVLL